MVHGTVLLQKPAVKYTMMWLPVPCRGFPSVQWFEKKIVSHKKYYVLTIYWFYLSDKIPLMIFFYFYCSNLQTFFYYNKPIQALWGFYKFCKWATQVPKFSVQNSICICFNIFLFRRPAVRIRRRNQKKITLKKHKRFYNSLKSNAIELKLCVYAHTMCTNDW